MAGDAIELEGPRPGDADPIVVSATEDGLLIEDTIERRRFSLSTPAPVAPTPADVSAIGAPVDTAVTVETGAITLPHRESVYVREATGEPVAHAFDSAVACPRGHYLIDITTSVKLYLAVDSFVTVSPGPTSTTIAFGGPTRVTIGARSPHRRPNGTVTTTTDLDDLRVAVESLSTSFQTTSPERSFPSLRGHPPLVELGDELAVPAHLSAPETGVTLSVDRSVEDLLVAAPLAFYLGAELRWGERRLRTDDGFTYRLDDVHDFETGVERTLRQVFLLDCLVRTEGHYPVELDERRRFEARTDGQLDLARLYDRGPAERLEAYLGLPFDRLSDLVPDWSVTTYVEPTPDAVAALPFLLDRLSIVRTTGPTPLEEAASAVATDSSGSGDGFTRASSASRRHRRPAHLVLPEDETTLTSAWVGDGVPIGAAKAIQAGFEHRLDREPVAGDIRIQVVCNDDAMAEERNAVERIYASRREVPFDVEIHNDLSTQALERAFARDTDFVHFIGHVDEAGFECRDGWFHAGDCSTVGADAFLLNSCTSYEQGEQLVEAGAIAGIVSLADLLNHRAAAVGRTMATFLNNGFPVYAAFEAARETHPFGDAYALLGDGQTVLSQPVTTFPEYLEVLDRGADRARVVHRTYPSQWAGLGTQICPAYEDGQRHYLLGGEIQTTELTLDRLASTLDTPMPIRDGGELRFSIDPSA